MLTKNYTEETTPKILILGALFGEINVAIATSQATVDQERNTAKFYAGILENHHVILGNVGVGKAMSAMNTQWAIDTYHPSHIIFIGLAGALNPTYRIGDIILGRETLMYDLDATALGFQRGEIPYSQIRYISADPKLLQLATDYISPQTFSSSNENKTQPISNTMPKLHIGRILTGDTFVTTANKSKLYEELKGDAVEMEGASVGLVAISNNIPHLIIRIISDQADGQARIDFARFLPQASKKLLDILQYVLKKIKHVVTL